MLTDGGRLLLILSYETVYLGSFSVAVNGLLIICSLFNEDLMAFWYMYRGGGGRVVNPYGFSRQRFFPKTIDMKALALVVMSFPQQNH